MATGKKYYWIKLRKDFMEGDIVDFLMGQKNGAQYVVLYQMLCLMCINTGGELSRKIGEVIIPFDYDKIQRDCKYFSRDTVAIALGLFKKLGLIYEQSGGSLIISDFENLIGSETDYARQKRIQRNGGQIYGHLTDTVHGDVCGGVQQQLDIAEDNVHSNVQTDVLEMSIQRKSIEKEYRENENIMCEADALALFERLWQMYPVKKGKGKISDAKKLKILSIGFDEMSRAIKRYKQYVESVGYLQYQNGSTFFNSGYIDYLDDNYDPVTGQKKQKNEQKNSFNSFPQRDYDYGKLEKQLTEN